MVQQLRQNLVGVASYKGVVANAVRLVARAAYVSFQGTTIVVSIGSS